MSLSGAVQPDTEPAVLTRLQRICGTRGLDGLAGRLAELAELVEQDMQALERSLAALPRGGSVVQRSANHLLDRGGKRLRPMCVALASRLGSGFGPAARQLAVAVELVHAATLLHDDVVDLGERRRGAAASRAIFGNAASIYAGDWLLVEALGRVRASGIDGTLERLLEIIEGMIGAEAIQLENRGRVRVGRESYFRVVEGKTAALFRWAMFAGARAGGLDDERCRAMEAYGLHLGVAFQLVDDLLDYTGDERMTGKELFADLHEGKMTYPLIVALERDPSLAELLQQLLEAPAGPWAEHAKARLLEAFETTGAFADCRSLAVERAERASECLVALPEGPARRALQTVATAAVHREA